MAEFQQRSSLIREDLFDLLRNSLHRLDILKSLLPFVLFLVSKFGLHGHLVLHSDNCHCGLPDASLHTWLLCSPSGLFRWVTACCALIWLSRPNIISLSLSFFPDDIPDLLIMIIIFLYELLDADLSSRLRLFFNITKWHLTHQWWIVEVKCSRPSSRLEYIVLLLLQQVSFLL